MIAFATLAAAAALLPASPTCHPNLTHYARAQLDGDPAREAVSAADSHDCAHTAYRTTVVVHDRCRGHQRELVLLDEQAKLYAFRVADVDGRSKRREIFVWTSKSAIVDRLADRRGLPCPVPVALYAYTPSPIPPGLRAGGFFAELGDFSRRFRGLELRVIERYVGAQPASRVTLYRYDRSQRRYVPYGSRYRGRTKRPAAAFSLSGPAARWTSSRRVSLPGTSPWS